MEKKINLTKLTRYLLKKFYLILIPVIIFSIAGFFWSKHIYTTSYKSESSFVVYHKNAKAKETDVSSIATYRKVIKNKVILNEVNHRMEKVKGYDGTADSLQKSIKTKNSPGTLVIGITTFGKTPKISSKIANTTIQVFKEKANTLLAAGTVKQLAKAESKDAVKTSDNNKKYVLLGAFIGLAIGVFIVLATGRQKLIN